MGYSEQTFQGFLEIALEDACSLAGGGGGIGYWKSYHLGAILVMF